MYASASLLHNPDNRLSGFHLENDGPDDDPGDSGETYLHKARSFHAFCRERQRIALRTQFVFEGHVKRVAFSPADDLLVVCTSDKVLVIDWPKITSTPRTCSVHGGSHRRSAVQAHAARHSEVEGAPLVAPRVGRERNQAIPERCGIRRTIFPVAPSIVAASNDPSVTSTPRQVASGSSNQGVPDLAQR